MKAFRLMLKKLAGLKNNIGFLKYLKNTGWMFAEQILRIVAGILVGVWVARYLGPEQFGVFSYALAFSAIFSGIAKLGLDGIVVRELVHRPEDSNIYLGTAFWLKVVGSIIVIFLMLTILMLTSNDNRTNLFILIIASGMIFQSFEVVEFFFQSRVKAKIISICKVAQLFLSSLVKIVLVLNDSNLIYFVIVALFDSVSLALSYIVAYKLNVKHSFYKYFDFKVARNLLTDAWPLLFSSVMILVYMRIDQIMIKEMLGTYEVGIYSAAVKLSEGIYFIPMLITASLFPAIVNAKKINKDTYYERLHKLYSLMIWGGIFVSLAIILINEWLIIFLYGPSYKEASQVLAVHMCASVFVFLGVAYSKYLLCENMNVTFLVRNLVAVIINLVLNYILIPSYGVFGAAIATLVSQSYTALFHDLFVKKLRNQFFVKLKAFYSPF